MKTLTNIGCFLIGWDKNILSECGEASHRQFRKLISALSIMLILWGTIGYCFADRYINLDSCLLKVCVSLIFSFAYSVTAYPAHISFTLSNSICFSVFMFIILSINS